MVDKIRIGFVGVGTMGQCAHLRNFATLPECTVVAIAEIRREAGAAVAARYGVKKTYPDHRAMFAAEKLDGIVASQPYHRHGILLPDLYQAGMPILTEKPLARSIEAGERLVNALAASKARHYVGYHKRSDPASMFAHKEIARLRETGELGAMRYVRILMPAGDWIAGGFNDVVTTQETTPPLEEDPVPADMGPESRKAYDSFVNYYIHQVNLMRHLMGESYRVSYADPSATLLVVHSHTGVPGTIEMSPYCTTVAWQEEILVAFERGFVRIELPAPVTINRPGRVTLYRDPSADATPFEMRPELPWTSAMRQQAVNFIRAIKGEKTPLCEAAEAIEDLRIARDYMTLLRGDLSA